MTRTIHYFRDEKALAGRAVKVFRAGYAEAVAKKGFFTVALSGGRSPLPFLRALAAQKGLDWKKVFFFFADERLTGLGAGASNFGTVKDLLFSKVPVPRSNIFPVPVSKGLKAAATYEKTIRGFFKGGKVRFDMVFLGLGTEGHTASLFPGSPALTERKKLAVAATAPAYAKPRGRVTLTFKALNSAGTAVFLVSGKEKKAVFNALISGQKDLPASNIRPARNLCLLYSE